jgi:transcriptional regulator with XRE-family HTH domain
MSMKAIDTPLLSAALGAARAALGLSMRQVADRSGLHEPNVARIENGNMSARWETFYRLIVGAGLGLEHFFPHDNILDAADRIRSRRRAAARRATRCAALR